MTMRSKVLRSKSDEPDTFAEGMSKQVVDEAHAQPLAASFQEEKKALRQKTLEKQQVHDVHAVSKDLQQERQMDGVDVDKSLSDFEKNQQRQKLFTQRIEKNILAMRNATRQQIRLLQALQADFIAKSASVGALEASSFSKQKVAVLDNANSLSSLISMSINDALNNAGKDKTPEESYFGTSSLLFSGEPGRQKSIVIHGAIVTLDEDVAQVITQMRSPILSKGMSQRKYAAADGVSKDTAKLIERAARDIVKEVERGQQEIEKQLISMDRMELQVEHQAYDMAEQIMSRDRYETEMAYSPVQYPTQSAYNYDYEMQTPYQRVTDPRPVRTLPEIPNQEVYASPEYGYYDG